MEGVLLEHEGIAKRLTEMGLSEAILSNFLNATATNTSNHLSNKDYFKLLKSCSEILHEPHIGLKIASKLTLSDLGLLGYIGNNSATFGDFCYAFERYLSVLMTGISLNIHISNDICEVRYHVLYPFNEGIRQDIELTIALIASGLKSKIKNDLRPTQVNFAHSMVGDIADYSETFGCKINFNQPYNSVIFDAPWLKYKLTDNDPQLLKALQKQANKVLNEMEGKQDFVQQVRLLISTCLGDESYNVEQLCQQLNISGRTLRRRLKKYNMTYSSLREDTIMNLAKEALIKTYASVTEIALKLNYSESSCFVRAFKKHCGISPLKFRNENSILNNRVI